MAPFPFRLRCEQSSTGFESASRLVSMDRGWVDEMRMKLWPSTGATSMLCQLFSETTSTSWDPSYIPQVSLRIVLYSACLCASFYFSLQSTDRGCPSYNHSSDNLVPSVSQDDERWQALRTLGYRFSTYTRTTSLLRAPAPYTYPSHILR